MGVHSTVGVRGKGRKEGFGARIAKRCIIVVRQRLQLATQRLHLPSPLEVMHERAAMRIDQLAPSKLPTARVARSGVGQRRGLRLCGQLSTHVDKANDNVLKSD